MTAHQDGDSDRLTAADVLRRYKEEDLPAFVEIELEDVNQAGNLGEHPLDVACTRGRMDEVAALIEAGADINAPGELGNTPLHEAVSQGHLEVVKFLLSRGASRTVANVFGETPLDLARSHRRVDILQLLAG